MKTLDQVIKEQRERPAFNRLDDTGADDDTPPDWCRFTVDTLGGLHCEHATSGRCADCPVGREFDPEDIQT